ncbi:MAG: 2-oxoacid:acceptor oxidoreductase family protein [Cephaloticoccus sp.]|nr:2-oxoacid:acceptor oxidoreductase family protein [Cephaloticoccus sp.]MCF7760082.1 2-oxoacid:acceptor oxidoreductase family protein [Cephaloticoccus sp.]
MSVFYDRFSRHAHGVGLKAHSTHYCPGCGHGVAHRDLAEAIYELGIQDRTVLISPVGCSVFAYYYFDVGNSQAAHGRAPAVALGHKLAHPEAVVISYQGDGDLASIGLAETISIAQMGLPITVIFINNAIYGMTGGQLAPTSLMGQKTTTSPSGRVESMGQPLKMAELIASLDGPVYVERVALYSARERVKARKAIKKAISNQIEGRGYSFVEIISECPTHLKMSPQQAVEWVKTKMAPVFPLGVKKDLTVEPWFKREAPVFTPEAVLGLSGAEPLDETNTRTTVPWPDHLGSRDIAIKFAGAGGDGAQTAALLLTRAAIGEGYDATAIPSYGPESRGGTSYADVHIAEREVLNPAAPEPNALVAFNAPSLAKFAHKVMAGGVILYDSTVVTAPGKLPKNCRILALPLTKIATDLGRPMVKNVVALGALHEALGLLPDDSVITTLHQVLKDKPSLLPLNEAAFAAGRAAVESNAVPA